MSNENKNNKKKSQSLKILFAFSSPPIVSQSIHTYVHKYNNNPLDSRNISKNNNNF